MQIWKRKVWEIWSCAVVSGRQTIYTHEQWTALLLPCKCSGFQPPDRHCKKRLWDSCWASSPVCLPSVYLMSPHMTNLPGFPPPYLHTASDQRSEVVTARVEEDCVQYFLTFSHFSNSYPLASSHTCFPCYFLPPALRICVFKILL